MSGLRARDREQEHRDGIRAILDAIPPGYDLYTVGFRAPDDGYHVELHASSGFGRMLSISSYDLPFVLRYLRTLPSTWIPDDRKANPIF